MSFEFSRSVGLVKSVFREKKDCLKLRVRNRFLCNFCGVKFIDSVFLVGRMYTSWGFIGNLILRFAAQLRFSTYVVS